MEILESITTTYMLKSANLSTCALTLKAKLNMETLVLVMLDEALGTLLPSIHRAVLNLEAHHYHREGLQSRQTAWPHPSVCLIQGLDAP